MQRNPQYDFKKSVATVLAGAGLAVLIQIEGTHALTRADADGYVVTQTRDAQRVDTEARTS